MADEADSRKWHDYYDRLNDKVPWNSGAPDSHLMQYIADLEARRAELGRDTWFPQSSLEVGCGFGATTRWLASKGLIRCVGVDLVAAPIDEAQEIACQEGLQRACTYICADVMEYARTVQEKFDLVFDMQCWHCMRQVHGDEASAKAVASFLNPGGILFSLCGNANEPACGPPVLRATDIVQAFEGHAGLRLLRLEETRFDLNPTYAKLPAPPLAWCAVFRKQEAAGL